MNNVGVIVNVQLWQVVFAAFMACGGLVSLGFGAATVFVRKGDCNKHIDNTGQTLKELFALIREIKDEVTSVKTDISYLKAKVEEK